MIDERELLEAAAARYTLEPGIVDRVYRRRDRQRRQQRITALVIGLAIAIAAVGIAIRIIEGGQRPKPLGPRITAENVAYLTEAWSAPLTGGDPYAANVSVADGNVYVVDRAAKQLLAFAEDCGEATCSPMWTARIDGDVHAGPVVDGGMVFLVSGQDVVAFETGCGSGGARCTPAWRGPVVGDTGPGVSLAVANGAVWVSTESDPPGPIIAYRADCGRGGSTCAPWWRSDRLSSPLVADGRLYVTDGNRMEAFSTGCEPLTEGCDPVWAWQPPGSGATIVAANTGVVLAQGNGEVYAIPTDCGSSCTPRWHAPGELLGVSEADGLIYIATWQGGHGELEAYCLDCTTLVFRAPVPPEKAGWPPGSLRRGSLGWGGVVGAGGAVIPGEDVVGLVPSDCGETCEITIVNTGGLGFVGQLGDVAVTGGVAFVANPHTGGVLLAYDLSCRDPCPPAWIWEADSQGHAIQPPVFDRTSMFLVDADEDASTLRAFRVGTTPQLGAPPAWGPDAGVVEHPDEGGIVAMSDAQQIFGTFDLDLDTGWMGPGKGSDLSLRRGHDAQALVYHPDATAWIHGGLAYLGQVDFQSISARDFPSFTWSHDPILRTGQLVPGAVFAVRTTEGNLSKVQVLRDDGYDLWLRWVTYDRNQVGAATGEPSGGSVDPLLIALLVASLVIVAAAWALVVRPRRRIRPEMLVGALLGAVIVLTGAACGAPASDGSGASSSSPVEPRSVMVDGRSFSLQCAGEGSPTVILESGAGDGIEIWEAASGSLLFDTLSAETRVCAYDRAGVSPSDPRGTSTFSPADVVSDLHALLTEAGIEPPYVLVGHSIAGLYLPVFASEYPTEVEGIVLLDPSTLWQFEGRQYREILRKEGPVREGGATLDVDAVHEQLDDATEIDEPLVVLTAGQWLDCSLSLCEQWVGNHRRLVRAATSSAVHIIVPNVDHYIQVGASPDSLTNIIMGVASTAPDGVLPTCDELVRDTDWACDEGTTR